MSVYVDRLSALAHRLERLEAQPEKRKRLFDMGTWVDRTPCGTSACAMGEACFIPKIRESGLHLRRSKVYPSQSVPVVIRRGVKHFGLKAARVIFNITEDEAISLFSPYDGNDTPGQVAEKIRRMIQQKTDRAKAKKAAA